MMDGITPLKKNELQQPDGGERNPETPTESNSSENIGDKSPDVASWEWDQFLLEGHKSIRSHDIENNHRCRLLVLSGTDTKCLPGDDEEILTLYTEEILKNRESVKKDNEKIKLLQKSTITNKIQFKLLDLGTCFSHSESISGKEFEENTQKMLWDIQEFQPTAIILPFLAVISTTKLDGMAGFIEADIVNLLRTRKPCLWQKKGLVVTNKKCLIF